jgi:hypothetical protein
MQQQLQSGQWGQVVEAFFDEPLDPPSEYPWEPCAIVMRNDDNRVIYVVLVEELSTNMEYRRWREYSRHNTYADALRVVAGLRPWGFR